MLICLSRGQVVVMVSGSILDRMWTRDVFYYMACQCIC